MVGKSLGRYEILEPLGSGGMRIGPFAAGFAGTLILPLAYWVRTWQSFATVRDICPRLFCDFADYYHPMGEAIFRTGLPVEGFRTPLGLPTWDSSSWFSARACAMPISGVSISSS